jgi:hypothetical protein
MRTGVLFDRYIVVDWSANNAPKRGKDSVWVCVLDDAGGTRTENPPTRGEAEAIVRAAARESVASNQRVLVGFDFPYGYPRGLATALGLRGRPWRAVWEHLASALEDNPETNVSNRFDVAAAINRRLGYQVFWGRPGNCRQLDRLSSDLSLGKSQCHYGVHAPDVAEYREVERTLRDSMRRSERRQRPHSVWQLTGTGCVGSQALTGIPVLERLVHDDVLAPVSAVWPFQVGVPRHPPGHASVVHAEIWPSLFDVRRHRAQVRDEAQVVSVAKELRERDRLRTLDDLFAAPVTGCPIACVEEGWILGAT